MQLSRFSIGAGDRFGIEGEAQIEAFKALRALGGEADIVWNKSNREHVIIGSTPADQARAAAESVKNAGWDGKWFVDADHITMKTVDWYIPYSNFFTIDVADAIGTPATEKSKVAYLEYAKFLLKNGAAPVDVTRSDLETVADKFLAAVQEAGFTYRHIAARKPAGAFVVELSMDETDTPQTPAQVAAILAAVAAENIPISTFAPRFPGRFLKGIDYVGNVADFLNTFEAEMKIMRWAPMALGLPAELKLSVHSGSDKYKLYKGIHEISIRLDAGLHLKTAGTTWLEEIVGLAEAGGDGLIIAKKVYSNAFTRIDELTAPYAEVVAIDRSRLPKPLEVDRWDSSTFVSALRHEKGSKTMNQDMRQLMHVGFRIAAELGKEFINALKDNRESVARNVRGNLFERHLTPIILG